MKKECQKEHEMTPTFDTRQDAKENPKGRGPVYSSRTLPTENHPQPGSFSISLGYSAV